MDRDTLKAIQAPLKKRYREEPETAQVSLHSRGIVRIGEQTCEIETGSGKVVAGLHRAAGGDGSVACSGDMLLDALVACAGVTLGAVATAMGLKIEGASIDAVGRMDFRGTMGISPEVAVGVEHIELHVNLSSQEPPEQLAKLMDLMEKYCVIYQTFQQAPIVETSWSIVEK